MLHTVPSRNGKCTAQRPVVAYCSYIHGGITCILSALHAPNGDADQAESAIQHFHDKLLHIRERMKTAPGRQMAEQRHKLVRPPHWPYPQRSRRCDAHTPFSLTRNLRLGHIDGRLFGGYTRRVRRGRIVDAQTCLFVLYKSRRMFFESYRYNNIYFSPFIKTRIGRLIKNNNTAKRHTDRHERTNPLI